MKSIVQELQAGATEKNQCVSDLLRKAKIVAIKLNLPEFLHWIENELNGYKNPKEIPPYRMMKGEPKGWNPYHGWVPLVFDDSDIYEKISAIPNNQPIGELEEIFEGGSKNLQISYDPEAQVTLGKSVGLQTRFGLIVDRSAVAGVLDAIRNIILDWSLKLEKEGILGEGISFTDKEKEKAHDAKTIVNIGRIDNLVGNVGSMADQASITVTQITQPKIQEIQNLTKQIKEHLNQLSLSKNDRITVDENIKKIESEIKKPKPEPSKLSKAFSSIKRIAEGASGNVIAQGIVSLIQQLEL